MRPHPIQLPAESFNGDVHLVRSARTHLVINENPGTPEPGKNEIRGREESS